MGFLYDRTMRAADHDVDEFQRTFDALAGAMRRGRVRSAHEANAGLTAAQADLLTPLDDITDGLPVSRIADAAGVAGPTATRMLGGLRDRGLVEHQRATHDARIVMVRLTPAGRNAITAHLQTLRARQRAVFNAFQPAEREQLINAVRHLTELINQT